MRRKFFTIASVISLLACLATAVLWVRSHYHGDRWERDTKAVSQGVTIYAGRIALLTMVFTGSPNDNGVARDGRWRHWPDDRRNIISNPVALAARVRSQSIGSGSGNGHAALGWGYGWWTWIIPGIGTRSGQELILPFWAIAALTLALPTFRMATLLRDGRRRMRGFCPNCSYDLTANISGICPECGTAIMGALRRGLWN